MPLELGAVKTTPLAHFQRDLLEALPHRLRFARDLVVFDALTVDEKSHVGVGPRAVNAAARNGSFYNPRA